MEVRAAFAFALALFLSMILVPVVIRLAAPIGLTDKGGARKIHAGEMPRTGGAAIFIGYLVPVLLWVSGRPELSVLILSSVVLFVFGLLDDRFNLDYRLKLLGQVIAALILTVVGGVVIEHVPYVPGGALPEPIAIAFTVFVLVGVTNAVNLSDGLDGLAGGISILAIGCLLLLAILAGDWSVGIIALAVVGATLGFLRFNTHPARLFMGDSGSQFLGFVTGALAIIVTQRSDPGLSPVLLLLILGLPILDTLTVMVGRLSRGQSPFAADRTHLHHRLLASGLAQYEAVSLIYAMQFLLVVLAYLMRYSFDGAILLTYVSWCALMLLGLGKLERRPRNLHGHGVHATLLGRLISKVRASKMMTRVPSRVLRLGLPVFLVIGALAALPPPVDVGLLSVALLVASGLAVLTIPRSFVFVERLSAYTAAVGVVYLLEQTDWLMDACAPCLRSVYVGFAVVTAVWVRFSSERFTVSSLDVLILFAVLVAPSLQDLGLGGLGLVLLESVVLFYGIELLMQERERSWDVLRIGVLLTLAVLAARGILS